MKNVLFVAGTDTGVGKTTVTAALLRALRQAGLRVAPFKPAESGCDPDDHTGDAAALLAASGEDLGMDAVCPYRFREPLAPGIAARRAGGFVDTGLIEARLTDLASHYDLVLCEGAGGLLVPFAGNLLLGEWIVRHRFPVLLVGRLGLGTINHTLLSADWLTKHGIRLVGTILSQSEPVGGVAEATNPDVLAAYEELAFMGVAAHGTDPLLPVTCVQRVRAFFNV